MRMNALRSKLTRLERQHVRSSPPAWRCPSCVRLREEGVPDASHVVLDEPGGRLAVFCKRCFGNWRAKDATNEHEPEHTRLFDVRPGPFVDGV